MTDSIEKARVDAVERCLADALDDRVERIDGYWRALAYDIIDASEKAALNAIEADMRTESSE